MYYYITLDIAPFLSFQDKYEPEEADGESGIIFIKVCHKVNRVDGRTGCSKSVMMLKKEFCKWILRGRKRRENDSVHISHDVFGSGSGYCGNSTTMQ